MLWAVSDVAHDVGGVVVWCTWMTWYGHGVGAVNPFNLIIV